MRKKGRSAEKLIYGILMALMLAAFCPLALKTVHASTITELQEQIKKRQEEINKANQKADELRDKQSLIEELIDDLNAEIINTMACIDLKEDEISEKEVDIATKEQQIFEKQVAVEQKETEYYYARAQVDQQKEDMEIRARKLYETGNTSLLHMILEGFGFGNLLNRMDYVEHVYSYDKNKLSEYEEAKKATMELWGQLQEEKQVLKDEKAAFEDEKNALELAKQELENQKVELDKALAVRKKESANYEAEIKKAKQEASVAKTLMKQEQQELKNLEDKEKAAQMMLADTGNFKDTGYGAIVDAATGSELGKSIAKYGLQFIGNKYVYGGTSLTNGTDCSGFTQSVYRKFGYSISRTSGDQRKDGVGVNYSDAQPGDIICYSGHVGLYIGGGKIVHASNKKDGIKVSNATYRQIIAVRRIIQ